MDRLNISYQAYQHPPLATCQDADRLDLAREGTRLKNLFLRDNYGRQHILLITTASKQIDLKALSKQQGLSRLGFASDSRLQHYLGIKPGCVSALATANDPQQHVQLWLDENLRQAALWQCHPFENDKTWVLSLADLELVWQHTGHQPQWLALPERQT
ncbi:MULTISPECIES: prolyl-tRNA synthetase associated domain-containing protein [unclassified Pseudoalteromonas]|uniref:prolyl-tRNA synthetase associated domain-containing protein n=1 Tax=unclassified Pseudoalteromonas TaxID=194690 RepID=UPI0020980251|nr:prolyl-tRNA synthetase associated domain-containing protein [Pseudoalteromonas sp. XMcav2-N]MCO7189227.1 prolyl-tRNA synthetase associated domain-containing protein [Pseudoalteromonas sp. XMcav2-N]